LTEPPGLAEARAQAGQRPPSRPVWGEPSPAAAEPVPLRSRAWAPDAAYRAEEGRSAEVVVLAASVAGVAHRLARRRGEDCYGWVSGLHGRGRLAVAVADGVGSAGRGGEGAQMAVEAALGYLAGCEGWGAAECEAAISQAGEVLARAGGPQAGELSTTLVVALVPGPDVTVARVGDSTAWALSAGRWRELFEGPRAGQPGGTTAALPLAGAASEVTQVHLGPGDALVLVTDGLGDPLRDGPATVAPALAEVLDGAARGHRSPPDLLAAVDFSRRGCHDDRTLVAVWPLSPAGPG